jgi:hypothetical protein
MTPKQAEELLWTLRGKRTTLADIYERARMVGSAWSVEQLQLFLLCAPGIEQDMSNSTFCVVTRGTDEALQDAIIEAVRSFGGKPVPAVQVRARLPNDFVTTDEQILAVARRTAGLDVFGPQLIRIAQ